MTEIVRILNIHRVIVNIIYIKEHKMRHWSNSLTSKLPVNTMIYVILNTLSSTYDLAYIEASMLTVWDFL